MTNEPSAPQTDGQQPTVERGGLWGLFFSTAGLLLPPFGLLLSAFGIIQGRKARRAAKASNGQAPGALMSMIVGWMGVVLSLFMIIGYAVFWTEYSAYGECSARAHTEALQSECDDALQEALAERLGVPPESIPLGTGL
ncbi:hypothetical protein HDA32_004876 [Spinactinospora alkalitolerans]|uniref:DUF4190 domain-containing protein n=1 Tax=Spinactinospora alkalitolerans TaxID=687207 RepID=A0A852TYW6_9ACTN|nr:DUF4190 domain-containing protein [Spinactinospora alkalitolerans]NYE49756.1 hypothetical protein [Spinactinospora alkalitolerans]